MRNLGVFMSIAIEFDNDIEMVNYIESLDATGDSQWKGIVIQREPKIVVKFIYQSDKEGER